MKLAHSLGFDADVVWNDDKNSELRALRSDPNIPVRDRRTVHTQPKRQGAGLQNSGRRHDEYVRDQRSEHDRRDPVLGRPIRVPAMHHRRARRADASTNEGERAADLRRARHSGDRHHHLHEPRVHVLCTYRSSRSNEHAVRRPATIEEPRVHQRRNRIRCGAHRRRASRPPRSQMGAGERKRRNVRVIRRAGVDGVGIRRRPTCGYLRVDARGDVDLHRRTQRRRGTRRRERRAPPCVARLLTHGRQREPGSHKLDGD